MLAARTAHARSILGLSPALYVVRKFNLLYATRLTYIIRNVTKPRAVTVARGTLVSIVYRETVYRSRFSGFTVKVQTLSQMEYVK